MICSRAQHRRREERTRTRLGGGEIAAHFSFSIRAGACACVRASWCGSLYAKEKCVRSAPWLLAGTGMMGVTREGATRWGCGAATAGWRDALEETEAQPQEDAA